MVWNDVNYKIISGVFTSEMNVEQLLNALDARGINSDLVNIMMSDSTRDQYTRFTASTSIRNESKMPEGLSTGAVSGGILGAILGGLTMAGSLLIPGLNVLVAGPIVGAIAGTAVGASTGGLVGALVGAGIPEYEAKAYEKDLKNVGNVLVIAHIPPSQANETKDLFKQYGAKDIAVQRETSQSR